jgi:hypothetical protein
MTPNLPQAVREQIVGYRRFLRTSRRFPRRSPSPKTRSALCPRRRREGTSIEQVRRSENQSRGSYLGNRRKSARGTVGGYVFVCCA